MQTHRIGACAQRHGDSQEDLSASLSLYFLDRMNGADALGTRSDSLARRTIVNFV